MSLSTSLLPKTNPYWQPLPTPTWSENLLALQNMIGAAASAPHDNGVMASPPKISTSSGTALPDGVALRARLTTHRGILQTVSGWYQAYQHNYVQSPSGIMSLGGVHTAQPTRGFYKRVINRVVCRVRNTRVIACMFCGTTENKLIPAIRPVYLRLIIDGRYASLNGDLQAQGGGAQWIVWTLPETIADAKITIEGGLSVAIDSVGVSMGGEILPYPEPTYSRSLAVLGDSITASSGAFHSYNGFVPKLADKLGFLRFFANGNNGTGLICKTPAENLLNAEERLNDVTDHNRAPRETLALAETVEAGQRTYMGLYLQAVGINDIGRGYTKTRVYDAQSRILDHIEEVCPWVPMLIAGPWDRNAPLAAWPGYATIRDGISLACEGRSKARFLDLEGGAYSKPFGDPTHPDDNGHTTCANDILYPKVVDAIDDMVARTIRIMERIIPAASPIVLSSNSIGVDLAKVAPAKSKSGRLPRSAVKKKAIISTGAKPTTKVEPQLEAEARVVAESTVEVEPMIGHEPVTDAGPVMETEPVNEAEVMIELEAMIVAEAITEADSMIEAGPMVEAESIVEVEPMIEAEPMVEIEPMVEAGAELKIEAARKSVKLKKARLQVEPRKAKPKKVESNKAEPTVAADLIMAEPMIEPLARVEAEPKVEAGRKNTKPERAKPQAESRTTKPKKAKPFGEVESMAEAQARVEAEPKVEAGPREAKLNKKSKPRAEPRKAQPKNAPKKPEPRAGGIRQTHRA